MVNLFQYLENVKGKPIPFKFKLLNHLSLTDEELIVDGDLAYSKIKQLPNNLTINGYLNLFKSKIRQLPDILTVNGNLSISETKIAILPYNLIVNGYIYCFDTPLANNIRYNPLLQKKYSKQVKGEMFYA